MTNNNNKIIISQDGSHSVLSGKYGVTYHSKYGAIGESQVVFIDAGLDYLFSTGKRNIDVFEMGFGTGLNALMSLKFSLNHQCSINYQTIEAYPIDLIMANELNYPSLLKVEHLNDEFIKMHQSKSGEAVQLVPDFSFTKYISQLEKFKLSANKYDCCFFDAFAPSAQEELWSLDIMSALFNALRPGGVLVSYCAKGVFKRTLKAAGFEIEAIPAPVGKREMTRAHKI